MRCNMFRLSACVALSLACNTLPRAQPLVPYVKKDRCPFECCRFGTWIAREQWKAYRSEGDTGRLAFRISRDDTIIAETGNTHLERAGRILVTKPIDAFQVGDTLIATECAGEEEYEVWHDGKPFDVPIFWKTRYQPAEEEYEAEQPIDSSIVSGVMLSRPFMTWWVKVRNKHGDTGWLRLVNRTLYCFKIDERLDGIDGCN